MQTECEVILAEVPDDEVSVVKLLHRVLELPVKEARKAVSSAPTTLLFGSAREEAERLKKQLHHLGAVVILREKRTSEPLPTLNGASEEVKEPQPDPVESQKKHLEQFQEEARQKKETQQQTAPQISTVSTIQVDDGGDLIQYYAAIQRLEHEYQQVLHHRKELKWYESLFREACQFVNLGISVDRTIPIALLSRSAIQKALEQGKQYYAQVNQLQEYLDTTQKQHRLERRTLEENHHRAIQELDTKLVAQLNQSDHEFKANSEKIKKLEKQKTWEIVWLVSLPVISLVLFRHWLFFVVTLFITFLVRIFADDSAEH